jgi:hypothetical protein
MHYRHAITVALIAAIATVSCKAESMSWPQRCPVEDILLDESLFHQDFYRWSPAEDAAPMRFGIEKIGVGFTSPSKGGAIQDVYRGTSVRAAQRQFADFVDTEFSSREGYTEWYMPDSLSHQSSVADQVQFACHKHIASGAEQCQAIIRYGPYLIRVHASMSSVLSYQDLERMLQAIDEGAAACLGR